MLLRFIMEKNNFFDERVIFSEQIGKYFDSKIPVTFNKLLDRYNFQIMSVDFEDLKQNTNLWNKNELDDGRTHIGLPNVKHRLSYFIDSEFNVESSSLGTTIKILLKNIKKEKK